MEPKPAWAVEKANMKRIAAFEMTCYRSMETIQYRLIYFGSSGTAQSASSNSQMQEAPLFWTCCESSESIHLNPIRTHRWHNSQRKTQYTLDRRHPGVDWYDNSGMYPDCRTHSRVDSCNVFVFFWL